MKLIDPPPENESPAPEPLSLQDSDAEAQTPSDAGQRFVAWLTRGIAERELAINAPKARLHVLPEGLALISPGIFKDFDPENWQQVQRRFQKLRLHRRTSEGTNIWTCHCQIPKGGKRSTIKVILIPDPAQRLGVMLPEINPAFMISECRCTHDA